MIHDRAARLRICRWFLGNVTFEIFALQSLLTFCLLKLNRGRGLERRPFVWPLRKRRTATAHSGARGAVSVRGQPQRGTAECRHTETSSIPAGNSTVERGLPGRGPQALPVFAPPISSGAATPCQMRGYSTFRTALRPAWTVSALPHPSRRSWTRPRTSRSRHPPPIRSTPYPSEDNGLDLEADAVSAGPRVHVLSTVGGWVLPGAHWH